MLIRKTFSRSTKASKDQPPVQAERKEALPPTQKSSVSGPVTTTRLGRDDVLIKTGSTLDISHSLRDRNVKLTSC